MTTPIPEAAVEAAARVIDHDAWTLTDAEFFEEYDDGMHGVAYCLRNRGARKETSLIHARAALTAARPLMEAEALSAWADYFDHCDDGPGRDPLTASKAAQLLRRPRPFGIAAANIAERTNDEPA